MSEIDPSQFRVKTPLKGYEERMAVQAMLMGGDADALIYFVDPTSRWPIFLQKIYLGIKRYIFRRPL